MNEFETRKKQRKDELAGLPWRAELRKVQCKRTKEQFLTPSQYGSLYFTKIKESLPVPTRYILRGASGEPSGNKTLLRERHTLLRGFLVLQGLLHFVVDAVRIGSDSTYPS